MRSERQRVSGRSEFGEAIGNSHRTIANIGMRNFAPIGGVVGSNNGAFRPDRKERLLRGSTGAASSRENRTISVPDPRNKAQNAELLRGWKARPPRFAGLSERTLKSRARELCESGYLHYIDVGAGRKWACAWTTDMAEWLEKNNGGRRYRVYALRKETVREPLNRYGGTELKDRLEGDFAVCGLERSYIAGP